MKDKLCWIALLGAIFMASNSFGQYIGAETNALIAKTNDGASEYRFLIFGTGALRSAVAESSTNEEFNDLLRGSLGFILNAKKHHTLTIGFNINGSQNKVINDSSAFAPSILIPDLGGNSFSLDYAYYFSTKKREDEKVNLQHAIKFTSLFSNNKWLIDSLAPISANQFFVSLQYRMIPFPRVFKKLNGDNNISFFVDAGFTLRVLSGDIGLDANDQLRKEVFKTDQTVFVGAQLDFGVVINTVNVGLSIPIVFTKKQLVGLSGPQLIFTTSLTANFVKFEPGKSGS